MPELIPSYATTIPIVRMGTYLLNVKHFFFHDQPHYTDEEIKDQEDEENCLKSHKNLLTWNTNRGLAGLSFLPYHVTPRCTKHHFFVVLYKEKTWFLYADTHYCLNLLQMYYFFHIYISINTLDSVVTPVCMSMYVCVCLYHSDLIL